MGNKSTSTYRHISYERSVLSDSSPIAFKFTSQASILLDEVNIKVLSKGNRIIPCNMYIKELKTKKIVGNKISFIPSSIISNITVKGLKSSLQRGRTYELIFEHASDNIDVLTSPQKSVVVYNFTLDVFGYGVTDPIWRIPVGSGMYLSTGGWQNYKESGSFIRTFDVGKPASGLLQDGFFSISDIVPSGSVMQTELYFTDDDIIATSSDLSSWNLFTVSAEDGMVLTKHRYWRSKITMYSNAARDFTPEIASMSIEYRPLPKTFGTIIESISKNKRGLFIPFLTSLKFDSVSRISKNGDKNLSKFNINGTKVNPKFQTSIKGGFTANIAENESSSSTFGKNIASRDCRIRIGYRGIQDTVVLYKARVSDVSYRKGEYSMTAIDNFSEFDSMIPSSKSANAWNSVSSYLSGDKVVFFGSLYSAISSNTAAQPDSNPLIWNSIGGAWKDIIYDEFTSFNFQKWHLVDIILDLIKNHINIHDSKIDFGSFDIVKSLLPDRTGTLYLRKPVKSKSIIDEASWLLESHIVVLNGKITLLKEPSSSDSQEIIEIPSSEIKENSLTWKAGWKDLKNECIILSAYDNSTSDQNISFGGGEIFVDADSVAEFDTVSVQLFKDKFNLSESELRKRASTFVNKWKRGRNITKFKTSINMINVEILSSVNITSKQLPIFTSNTQSAIIVSKDIDWLNQEINFIALEMK